MGIFSKFFGPESGYQNQEQVPETKNKNSESKKNSEGTSEKMTIAAENIASDILSNPEIIAINLRAAAPGLAPEQSQTLIQTLQTEAVKENLKNRLKNALLPALTGSSAGFIATAAAKGLIRNSFRAMFGGSLGIGIAAGAVGGGVIEGTRVYLKERNKFVADDILKQLHEASTDVKKAAILKKAEEALKDFRISQPERTGEISHAVRLARTELEAKAKSPELADKNENQKIAFILQIADANRAIGRQQKKEIGLLLKQLELKTEKSQINKRRVLQAVLKGAAVGALGGAVGGAVAHWLSEVVHPAIFAEAAMVESQKVPSAEAGRVIASRMEQAATSAAAVLNSAKARLLEANYQAIAQKGEGLTHIARKGLHDYIANTVALDNSTILKNITPEQLVYAEDYLVKQHLHMGLGAMLHPGDKIEFSGRQLAGALNKIQGINPEQMRHLQEMLQSKEHFVPTATKEWMTDFSRFSLPANDHATDIIKQAKEAAASATIAPLPSLTEEPGQKWMNNLGWYGAGVATGAVGGITAYKYYKQRQAKRKAAATTQPEPPSEHPDAIARDTEFPVAPPSTPTDSPVSAETRAAGIAITAAHIESEANIQRPAAIEPEQQALETAIIPPPAPESNKPEQEAYDLTRAFCKEKLPRFTARLENLQDFQNSSLEIRRLLLDSLILLFTEHPEVSHILESHDFTNSSQGITKKLETFDAQIILNGQEVSFSVNNFGDLSPKDITDDVWLQISEAIQQQASSSQTPPPAYPSPIQTPEPESSTKFFPGSVKSRPEEADVATSRAVSAYALSKMNEQDILDLRTVNVAESDKIFIEKIKKLTTDLVVHGIAILDKATGNIRIKNRSDLDGESCLGLLHLAGLSIENVKYVKKGSNPISGAFHLDTGNKDGIEIQLDDNETATLFADHHGGVSTGDTSSTKHVYEMLLGMKLLKPEPYLEKLVEFVTQLDNKSFPDEENYYTAGDRTVLGLSKFISFKKLRAYFKSGRSPVELLSPQEIKELGATSGVREVQELTKKSLEGLEAAEKDGFVVESPTYGKIVVDIQRNGKRLVPHGWHAAKAKGYGGYVLWDPDQPFFFVTTREPLAAKFPQGKNIRGRMWILTDREKAGQQLEFPLKTLLQRLGVSEASLQGELKKYIGEANEKNSTTHPVVQDIPASTTVEKEIKPELETNYSAIVNHFQNAPGIENLTPEARKMYDQLLADALPEALKEFPPRAKTLLTIPIEFHFIDRSSDKITEVTYIYRTKTLSFAVGGKNYEYAIVLENFKGDLQTIG